MWRSRPPSAARARSSCRLLGRGGSGSSTSWTSAARRSSGGLVPTEPRTVLVSGGSKGLGAAIVQSFLDTGDRVATCSRATTDLVARWTEDDATGDRFRFVACDLTDRPSVKRF